MTKQKVKTVKGLVEQLRDVRDKMNKELANMTTAQRLAYFRKMREKENT